jgi:uncharacterized protein
MTPVLVLLFGIHPSTVVGTDLLFAASTKTLGTLIHGLARNIDWRLVGLLAAGSVPATIASLFLLSAVDLDGAPARRFTTVAPKLNNKRKRFGVVIDVKPIANV